jgi:hypothetical protein
VALVQRDKDRPLVREILVDRANTYASDLGNAIRRDSTKAFAFQQSDDGVEHRIDSLTGTALLRLASTRAAGCLRHTFSIQQM